MIIDHHHEYDMGYTAAEFAKVLNGSFSGARSSYRISSEGANQWRVYDDQGLDARLRITPKPARKLGLLELPVLTIKFDIISDEYQTKSMLFEHFFKHFQKGGG